MGFSFRCTGLDELMAKMDKAPENAADVAALALYEGAAIVADSVSGAIGGIATEKFRYAKGWPARSTAWRSSTRT